MWIDTLAEMRTNLKHHVKVVLVGGYALIANKVQRMTFDIDFILTLEDLKKKLNKAKVELEVINLFGDFDSPKKRKEWETEIAELEKQIKEIDV